MPHPSDQRLLVLHGLRLSGFSTVERVAERYGLAPEPVTAELEAAAGQGLALHRQGRLSGWMLTPAGRAEDARLVEAELADAGVRGDIDAAYRRFLNHNAAMLQLCTDWQVRDAATNTLNDHGDPAYDAAVLDRLAELHAAASGIWLDLAGLLDRFGTYGPRFEAALERLGDGDLEWFTKPLIDSYHTVWFELHEDLLSTLAIERAKEGAV